jgi:TolB-like protein
MDLDPFNVIPLKALLAVTEEDHDMRIVPEAAHAAARLVAERRWRYPPGIFDELFARPAARLKALPPALPAVRRALRMIELALAPDEAVKSILLSAIVESPDWPWPSIELARGELAQDGAAAGAAELVERVLRGRAVEQNWIVRHERGDALVLHAELRAQNNDWRGARRDIERSLAYGVSRHSLEPLLRRVDDALKNAPRVSSVAVMPFDSIYSDEPGGWGHSLSWSTSAILRAALGPAVRSLDRDALEDADWNAFSPAEVGRRSGIGAVLTGRYAKARRLVIIDVRIIDSITGDELFSHRYETSPKQLRETQITIAENALEALRLPPSQPVREVVISSFSGDPKAYANYLAGMDILLSGTHGAQELRDAATFFAVAVARDKKFGRAYAGRAWTLYSLANLHVRPRDIMPDAVEAAERGVKYAPNATEALLALALIRTWYDWDFDAGRKAFEAALEVDPFNSTAHRLYGDFLAARNELEHAL